MIGRVQGNILEKSPHQVVVDVQGLGYEIEIPLTTYFLLGDTGSRVTLFTHQVVREDAHLLFGFYTATERELFRALIKVNSVGPKLAVAILSGVDAAAFSRCIQNNDVKTLTSLPGVGKKTAERLIIELRDRLPVLAPGAQQVLPQVADFLADAETALIGLGYKPQDAARVLGQLEDQDASVENLIRQALKALS
ncbi:MAG: Holliday junction branch migration protein RuvA [Pseudomonadales bacterium]|nr:Holliday junction branch migration protein RuvA [Pseudomonadales bacterium]MDP4639186.1 Holliday junction branch migration protein RuvA [Pseudomonadales bacterium]MDP4764946.1 Holliday junction branch migration protein RuvA [Pseudomonadales bacterium]MDP4874904.1 Holliday junction branch migration protein RuvA [Pseudomonadales bacterium]MDP4912621.1 Holliday junction branch migration protein RuvA [Pseudomonadales bacterium]